ncbi:hypothetical protein P9112_004473 [Eukaryota sp. TZLM1-RC]
MRILTHLLLPVLFVASLSSINFSLKVFPVINAHTFGASLLISLVSVSVNHVHVPYKSPAKITTPTLLTIISIMAIHSAFSTLSVSSPSHVISISLFAISVTLFNLSPLLFSVLLPCCLLSILTNYMLSIPLSIKDLPVLFSTLFSPLILFCSVSFLTRFFKDIYTHFKSISKSLPLLSFPLILYDLPVFANPPGRVNLGILSGFYLGFCLFFGFLLIVRVFFCRLRNSFLLPSHVAWFAFFLLFLSVIPSLLVIDGYSLPLAHFLLTVASLLFGMTLNSLKPNRQQLRNHIITLTKRPLSEAFAYFIWGILLSIMLFLFLFPGRKINDLRLADFEEKSFYSARTHSPYSLDGRTWARNVYNKDMGKSKCGLQDETVASMLQRTQQPSSLVSEKHLYLSLITSNDFYEIVLVWAWSLKRTLTNATIGVLMLDNIDRDGYITNKLNCMGVEVFPIPKFKCPPSFVSSRYCSAGLFSKLYSWSLTQFESVIFLDADIVALDNLDDLFFFPGSIAVAPNHPNNLNDLNGGFFALRPSEDVFNELTRSVLSDSGLYPQFLPVNSFFGHYFQTSATRLPTYYHGQGHRLFCNSGRRFLNPKKLKTIHYFGAAKPWTDDRQYSGYDYFTVFKQFQHELTGSTLYNTCF